MESPGFAPDLRVAQHHKHAGLARQFTRNSSFVAIWPFRRCPCDLVEIVRVSSGKDRPALTLAPYRPGPAL
jgi:hypothetical protein